MRWPFFVTAAKLFLGSHFLLIKKRDSVVYFNEVKKSLIQHFPDIKKRSF